MTALAFVLIGVVLALMSYFGYLVVSSWLEVRSSPREEMIFCPKHGPIRKSATLNFMGQDYCGICFHNRFKAAEHGIEPEP